MERDRCGRPIRPGRGSDGSLLLPLEKTRTGEEAPAFVVEIAYLDRAPSWADKGRTRLSLVAVDLPISKTRLLLHHPPLFRLSAVPGLSGSFRVAPYVEAESEALRSDPLSFHASVSQHEEQSEETKNSLRNCRTRSTAPDRRAIFHCALCFRTLVLRSFSFRS